MKKVVFVLAAAVLLVGCTTGGSFMQDLEARAAAMGPPPGEWHPDIVYKDTAWGEMKLDLYMPHGEVSGKIPVHLYIHGGSFLHGTRRLARLLDPWVEIVRKSGMAVISIDYRYVNQVPFKYMIEDCRDAVQWIRTVGEEKYNLDGSYVGAQGASAGGHLALMTALTVDGPKMAYVIDEYGPTDLIALANNSVLSGAQLLKIYGEPQLTKVSPAFQISDRMPPLLILHGDADVVVPIENSVKLKARVEEFGIPVRMEVIEGGRHGFFNATDEIRAHLLDVQTVFLREQLKVRS